MSLRPREEHDSQVFEKKVLRNYLGGSTSGDVQYAI
jgi:hypothetical protein